MHTHRTQLVSDPNRYDLSAALPNPTVMIYQDGEKKAGPAHYSNWDWASVWWGGVRWGGGGGGLSKQGS